MGFFQPNIDRKGRIARVITGVILAVSAGVAFWQRVWWLGGLLAFWAIFCFFEAKKRWCVMRACGIKTKY